MRFIEDKMNFSQAQIAEAFSSHRFSLVYPYLSKEVRWRVLGGEHLNGSKNVIDACEKSAKYLADVSTKFIEFKTIAGLDCVVIESIADYVDKQNQLSKVASCDIYRFADDKVCEITSYNIELDAD